MSSPTSELQETIKKCRYVSIRALLRIPYSRGLIRCPFHRDSTPSFMIYPDNGYHCFGCGKHGSNAIDFVMELGYDFGQAVNELKNYI